MASNQFEALYGFVVPTSTTSYDDSASPHSDNEDDHAFGNLDAMNGGVMQDLESGVDANGKRKSRRPPSTAERRATHNAVERARRESLNGRFVDLAAALPNMATIKRPSKSTIVAKSLEYVNATEDRERSLRQENANLRKEVDDLRAKLGLLPNGIASPVAIIPAHCSPLNGHGGPRERVGSFDDSTSSMFSASPSSGTSFDNAGTPLQGLSVSPPYNSVFNRALLAEPPKADPIISAAKPAAIIQSMPIPISGMPFHIGMQAAHTMSSYETNYLMALSMQQQHAQQQQQQQVQQQNALNLALGGGNAGPTWPTYNFGGFHGMNHPISSGMPDYPSNLVFA